MARIELDGVSLAYPGGGGVRDISLDISDGEYVALLGPSGSGKTTLLRLIAGFLAPDDGTVGIGGRPVASPKNWIPPEERNLGMVFQEHAVWPHMNVAKNVEYPLKRAGIPKAERRKRAGEALDLVGLSRYSERLPDTLSGGQQQRVSLARALVSRPAALLLDEPLASLDAALKEKLRVELGALAGRTGSTVVHVTHDREEALGLADRVAVMNDGTIEQIATPKNLLSSPATPFVASFVADASLIPVSHKDGKLFDKDLEIPVGEVAGLEGAGEGGVLALRPRDVSIEPEGEATVRAALFNGDLVRVYLDWRGYELRAVADAGANLRSGDRVRPVLRRGVLFPEDPTRTS